jgi:hypothetical protein
MSGIPTLYDGIQYRSRLEAKWAAFFDLLGWPFQYEPFDLKGWIPDFLILGKYQVLVEVKPVMEFPERVASQIDRSCPPTGRGRECVNDQEVLILGCSLLIPVAANYGHSLGWLRECGAWGRAHFGRWADAKTIGFCHSAGSFHDRMSGHYDGDRGPSAHDDRTIIELWNRAGNAVQWKAPRPMPRPVLRGRSHG